ncbi:MAG: class I SAM-dependent methyltransferase [Polyangiales bacterium]
MTSTTCPACHHSAIRAWLSNQVFRSADAEFHFELLGCDDCGLGFVYPEPSLAQLATFYPPDYQPYETVPESPQAIAHSFKYRVARMRHARDAVRPTRHLEILLGAAVEYATGKTVSYSLGLPLQLPRDARILELGYGSGSWLLSMAALGYHQLHGYDIASNDRQAVALTQAGVEVTSGSFLDNNYPAGSFDCIRLEHVFEHLIDPLRVLTKLHSLLKPGGRLVMNLPCIDSWSVRVSLRHFPHLDVPRHLYHHTGRSLTLLLEAAGFRALRRKSYADAASLAGAVNGLLGERFRAAVPMQLFRAVAPAYKLACQWTRKGDLVTLTAVR